MAWQGLRNIIKAKLESISSIQEVQDYPNDEFGGYPAAMVESTRNEADFQTTTENKRNYIFTIYLFQESESKGEKQARRIIEGVTDDVIEAFDQDQLLTGVSLPSNEELAVSFPMLSQIYTSDDAKYVVGELELRILVQFSTT